MKNVFQALGRVYLRFVARQARPIMIYYRKNFQGKKYPNIRISSSSVLGDKKQLILHKNVYIGHFNRIDASNGIEIAEGVQLASYCSIVTHSSHQAIRLYGDKYQDFKNHIGYHKGSVFIGKYTFIGPHSFIMPNTTIGKGCLIKAYSYVKGDFPDFSIIAGNPAKIVGDTRDKDKILLKENPDLSSFYNDWANS